MVLQEFQESKRAEKIVFSWPAIVLAAFLCLAALWGIVKVLRADLVLQEEIGELERKIDHANVSRTAFEKRLAVLRTEEGLDREARGKLNLKRPGEEAVAFVGDELPENTAGKTGQASFWDRLKKWLNF